MAKKLVAAVNTHGPEGVLVLAGEPIPTDWPPELVEALEASGGAERRDVTKKPEPDTEEA